MTYVSKGTVILLSIGRELLRGQTRDSDGPYLAENLTALGFEIERMIVLDDEEKAIGEELRDALGRHPRLLFTTGGLGPTFDDRTLRAVAKALRRRLRLHPEALDQVRSYYRAMRRKGVVPSDRLSPERKKMAILPEGAEPLRNPCGAAPGVRLEVGGTTLFCLPGVPPEMKSIFRTAIRPELARGAARGASLDVPLHTRDESSLAPLVRKVMRRFPGVYVKSRVRGAREGIRIVVTFHSAPRERLLAAADMLKSHLALLR